MRRLVGLILMLALLCAGCGGRASGEVTLIWRMPEGEELYRTQVSRETLEEEGRSCYYEAYQGEFPTKASEGDFDYFFEMWIVDEEASDENTRVLVPDFFSCFKRYQLTWLDEDGTVLDVTTGLSGRDPLMYGPSVLPEPEDSSQTYEWEPELRPIDGDATYRAHYISR